VVTLALYDFIQLGRAINQWRCSAVACTATVSANLSTRVYLIRSAVRSALVLAGWAEHYRISALSQLRLAFNRWNTPLQRHRTGALRCLNIRFRALLIDANFHTAFLRWKVIFNQARECSITNNNDNSVFALFFFLFFNALK
jgi:hypothetical protein